MVATFTLTDVLPYAAIGIAVAVAVAGFMATRKDERYKVASGERDEYRARAERLADDLRLAREELADLRKLPRLVAVTERLAGLQESVDDLQESIDVHAGRSDDRRRKQLDGPTPQRRITDQLP